MQYNLSLQIIKYIYTCNYTHITHTVPAFGQGNKHTRVSIELNHVRNLAKKAVISTLDEGWVIKDQGWVIKVTYMYVEIHKYNIVLQIYIDFIVNRENTVYTCTC